MVPKTFRSKLSLAIQGNDLISHFPGSKLAIRHNHLDWRADIFPTPLSLLYTIQLKYSLEDWPRVFVLKPELKVPEGKRLPHVFPEKRLCVYLPGSGEWHGSMLLSKTLVPWISEWLLNYEIWYSTGVWCGGGIHPPVKSEKEIDE